MNIFITLILLVVVVTGVVFSKGKNVDTESVAGVSTSTNVTEDTPTPDPTKSPTPSASPVPISNENENSQDLDVLGYRYPSSLVVSSDSNSLVLESSDDSDKITDWYKDKIAQEGLSVRTSVKTKTNNKVLNKLVGSNGQEQVRIEISKQPNNSITRISVVLDI